MVDKYWTLYKHVSPSGKVYIGITSLNNVMKRWLYGNGYKSCAVFYRAIKKYGWDKFNHTIIATNLGELTAKLAELDFIKFYKDRGISYNITDGGDGTLGRVFSNETILKMKLAHIGKTLSESHKLNMRLSQLKRTKYDISEHGKDNIRKGIIEYYRSHNSPRKGVKLTDESKAKNMMSLKTRKSIILYDLDMNIINEYPSISFASRVTGFTLSRIAECCKKMGKYKNYYWRYKDGQ